MIILFVLLPFVNRTEPEAEVPPVRFAHPGLTVLSPPVVQPPEPEKSKMETVMEEPNLETAADFIEIRLDPMQNSLAAGDGMVITDASEFFVPLIAFDTFDLEHRAGPFRENDSRNPYETGEGVSGAWARIQFVVEADGSVSQARIDAASDGDFGKVGLDAIRNWPFTPTMTGEKSVRTWVVQPFPLRTDR
jgi:hypothetical protein